MQFVYRPAKVSRRAVVAGALKISGFRGRDLSGVISLRVSVSIHHVSRKTDRKYVSL